MNDVIKFGLYVLIIMFISPFLTFTGLNVISEVSKMSWHIEHSFVTYCAFWAIFAGLPSYKNWSAK